MTAVVYPPTLPAPSLWGGQPFDRAARSPLPGNTQLRGRSRDALQDVDAAWVYSAAEMAAWVAWYDGTLLKGMRWFAMVAPGASGFVGRVLKFRTNTVRRELLGNGNFRVSAKMQQRGISQPPLLLQAPMVWTPSDVSWAMSNGNKTATDGVSGNAVPHIYYNLQGSRYASGKLYWEVYLNDASSSANDVGWCGFVTSVGYRFAVIHTGFLLQCTGAVPDIYALPNTNLYGSVNLTWGAPRTLGFAVDTATGEVWLRTETGWRSWDGGVTTPNPATAYRPYPLLNPLTEAIRPEVYHLPNLPTFTCTLRSAASEMAYAIPAGFDAIGGN